tara:strand:+ start:210 stop:413 length:204 start_codon:yes stop_codon:yes gene_type:complete
MAWYNINSSDGIAKEFDQKKRVARCGFCGQEKLIKTEKKIFFSEFEVEDRPICFDCYHQHSKKAVAR